MPAEGGLIPMGSIRPSAYSLHMGPRAKLTIQAHPPVCRLTGETWWAFFFILWRFPRPSGRDPDRELHGVFKGTQGDVTKHLLTLHWSAPSKVGGLGVPLKNSPGVWSPAAPNFEFSKKSWH